MLIRFLAPTDVCAHEHGGNSRLKEHKDTEHRQEVSPVHQFSSELRLTVLLFQCTHTITDIQTVCVCVCVKRESIANTAELSMQGTE